MQLLFISQNFRMEDEQRGAFSLLKNYFLSINLTIYCKYITYVTILFTVVVTYSKRKK